MYFSLNLAHSAFEWRLSSSLLRHDNQVCLYWLGIDVNHVQELCHFFSKHDKGRSLLATGSHLRGSVRSTEHYIL